MYRKIRICLVALTLFACSAMSLWEAGAIGAGVGTVTTMLLDDDNDVIIDGEGAIIAEAESNAYSVLEVVIDNAIPLSILVLVVWLAPSPSEIRRKLKIYKEKRNEK